MASTGLNLATVSGVSAKTRRVGCPPKTVPVMVQAFQHTASPCRHASSFVGRSIVECVRRNMPKGRAAQFQILAVKDGAVLDRPLRVAVIGGGPSGACTAETLAKGGIETYLIERKLDNCKVCAWFF
jgi:NADPH-dependent 2,4-dienoyl-CoA reductase/sulfur reductase-like enzyme